MNIKNNGWQKIVLCALLVGGWHIPVLSVSINGQPEEATEQFRRVCVNESDDQISSSQLRRWYGAVRAISDGVASRVLSTINVRADTLVMRRISRGALGGFLLSAVAQAALRKYIEKNKSMKEVSIAVAEDIAFYQGKVLVDQYVKRACNETTCATLQKCTNLSKIACEDKLNAVIIGPVSVNGAVQGLADWKIVSPLYEKIWDGSKSVMIGVFQSKIPNNSKYQNAEHSSEETLEPREMDIKRPINEERNDSN